MTILEFSRGTARHPRRPGNRKPKEKAVEKPAAVTRIHTTIGQFLEATFPPRDEAEVAGLDFAALPEFVMHNGHSGTDEFAIAMQKWLQNINVMARFSMVLCGKSKSETMAAVRETQTPSEAEELYSMLKDGCEDAERLVRMIRAGQMRQLTVLSSIAAEMNNKEVLLP